VFNLSLSVERVIGPVLVTGALLKAGDTGWAPAALIFISCGLAGRRTDRTPTRPEAEAEPPSHLRMRMLVVASVV
jgi:hypothetical protein